MRIPESTINEITERIDMVEIVGGYIRLERRGNRYWGLCPFHNEKTPSFTLLPDLKGFHCFGCGKGGSMFSFVQEIENVSFPEAVRILAEKAGIEIPEQPDSAEDKRKTALKELYNRVAGSFHHILTNTDAGARAREYLEKRGIGSDIQEDFLIGYAPAERGWLFNFLKKKNYSESFLAESGLFSRRYKETALFWNRIMFPIRNARGDVVAFGGRIIEGDGPKYINSPETPLFLKSRTLYGLHNALPAIRKSRKFILAEGYLDVIAFHKAGIPGCVAPLGTAVTAEQVRMLKRYAGEGLLVFDGDEAGVNAAVKALTAGEAAGVDCSVVELPEGKDPADIVELEGTEALNNLLKFPINGFTFVIRNAIKSLDIDNAGAKEKVVRKVVPVLAEVQSEVRRESYVHELADALRVDPNSVQKDIARISTRGTVDSRVQGPVALRITPELYLMLAVAANFHMFKEVRNRIRRDDLEDDAARALYVSLEESFRNEENSLDSILARIEDKRVREALLKKSASGEFGENYVEIISGTVSRVRERSLMRKRLEVQRNIRELEKEGDAIKEMQGLLEEKIHLDTELENLRGRNV